MSSEQTCNDSLTTDVAHFYDMPPCPGRPEAVEDGSVSEGLTFGSTSEYVSGHIIGAIITDRKVSRDDTGMGTFSIKKSSIF